MTKPTASDVAQMLDRSRHVAGLYDLAADTVADLIAERDRLSEIEDRLSVLLWRLTSGKLSGASYPVDVMEQEIEECLAGYYKCENCEAGR